MTQPLTPSTEDIAAANHNRLPAVLEHQHLPVTAEFAGLSPAQQQAELMGGDQAVTWCSMPGDNADDRMLMYAARHNPALDLDDHIGKPLTIRAAIVHWATKGTPGSDIVDRFTRTVLLSPDGTLYESFSVGIRDSIRDLAFALGAGPWEPAAIVEVYKIKCSQPSPLQKLKYVGRAKLNGTKK